jgi:hypothetical protein
MGYCLAKRLGQSITPLRIACSTDAGCPLVVPLWFIYEKGCFCSISYCSANLLSHLWVDKRVGVEVADNEPPYAGVRGHGDVTLLEDEGGIWLPRLLQRCQINPDSALARGLMARVDDEITICLEPGHMSGRDCSPRMQDSC